MPNKIRIPIFRKRHIVNANSLNFLLRPTPFPILVPRQLKPTFGTSMSAYVVKSTLGENAMNMTPNIYHIT